MLRQSFLVLTLAFQAASPTPQGWSEITSKDDRFVFAMPAKPKEKVRPANSKAADVTAFQYACTANDCDYVVEKTQLRAAVAEDQKDRVLDGFIKSARDLKILSQKKVDLDGHPGREVMLEASMSPRGVPVKWAWRVFLVGDNLLEAKVIAQKPGTEPKEAEAFFRSIRVKPAK